MSQLNDPFRTLAEIQEDLDTSLHYCEESLATDDGKTISAALRALTKAVLFTAGFGTHDRYEASDILDSWRQQRYEAARAKRDAVAK